MNSDIRMFTASGEVKDAALIMKHLNKQAVSKFFSTEKQETGHLGLVSLNLKDQKVNFKLTDGEFPANLPYKQITPTRYLINNTGTLRIKVSQNNSYIDCQRLADKMLLYPMKRVDVQLVPATTGFQETFIPSIDYVMESKGSGVLIIPMLSYVVSGGSPTSTCMLSYGNQLNLPGGQAVEGLVAGDTIVYQEKKMYLQKQ